MINLCQWKLGNGASGSNTQTILNFEVLYVAQ